MMKFPRMLLSNAVCLMTGLNLLPAAEMIATEGTVTVDGVCSPGEWDNTLPYHGFRCKHSGGMLYFLVDRPWDQDSHLPGEMVYREHLGSWLLTDEIAYFGSAAFDINQSGAIEAGVDFRYSMCQRNVLATPRPTPHGFKMPLEGYTSRIRLVNETTSNGCDSGGATAAVAVNGFGASIYTATPHRVHEVAIPLAEVGGAREFHRVLFKLPYMDPFPSPGWTMLQLRKTPNLTFDEIVSIYDGYFYAFDNGYVDPRLPEDSEVVGSTLDCTSFASVVLQRLKHQEEWRTKMNRTFHYYLGSELKADQLKIGKLTFSADNVDRATEVFSAGGGLAERMGLTLADRVLVSEFQRKRGSAKLEVGKLYFFDVQKWATNPAGTGFAKKAVPIPGSKKKKQLYTRQGHVGFFRIGEDGAYEQVQYSETHDGLLRGDFRDWLDGSARYSAYKFNAKKPASAPKPANKLQAGCMYLSIFEVPEPEFE